MAETTDIKRKLQKLSEKIKDIKTELETLSNECNNQKLQGKFQKNEVNSIREDQTQLQNEMLLLQTSLNIFQRKFDRELQGLKSSNDSILDLNEKLSKMMIRFDRQEKEIVTLRHQNEQLEQKIVAQQKKLEQAMVQVKQQTSHS